jgi:hypothetical protein
MASQRTDWRFFTKLEVSDCVVTQTWCWEEFMAGHEVVASGSGFTTLPAAMRDARRHGFDGSGDSVHGRPQLRRADDWARGEDVLDRPFGWLNTGTQDSEWVVVDDTRVVPERRGNREGATLRD